MNRILVDILEGIDEPEWFGKIEPFLQKVATELKLENEEISVLFCDDKYIQELNKMYRNIDAPTDVLSFENDDEYEDEEGVWRCVGDIAISLDTLPVNAEYFNVTVNTELKRLLVHGLLHLNGYDHGEEHLEQNKEPECEMLILQENLLKTKLKDEIIIK
ncbi:MAG: rRNA maturation RNase YbeY [Treponema sp.]|nr:rRNA maturation RNase YbeY [Treponema sp.]